MFSKKRVTLLRGFNGAYEENKYRGEDFQCTSYHYRSKTVQTRHGSLLKTPLENVLRFQMSNVTLLSPRSTLQEVMHILLWMLVNQPENLQYYVETYPTM